MRSAWWRLVRFGFRLLYNEFAWTYDTVSFVVSLGAWRCWQRSILRHLEAVNGVILELAHGTGNLQIDLRRLNYRIVGVDFSTAMGHIAQRKLRGAGLSSTLAQAKAQELPFQTGAFAAVVTTFPTDFIASPKTLAEIRRVLRQDGVLVIVPGAMFVSGGALRRLLEWAYRVTGQRMEEAGDEELRREAERWIGVAGFTVQVVLEACPRSKAIVLIARKTP